MIKPTVQSPKMLEDLLTLSKQSVVVFSRDGECMSAWGSNPFMPQPLRGTIIGLRLPQLVEGAHLESIKLAFDLAIESELPQSLILESRATGVLNLIEVILYPLRTNNSTQVAACFRNAEWAKQERSRFLEATMIFNALKAAAKIGSFVIDLSAARVSVCESYRKIFEIEENSIFGKDLLLMFFDSQHAFEIEIGLERCALGQETFNAQLPARTVTGKRLMIEFFAEPERNDLEVVHRIRGFVQDIARFAEKTLANPRA